MVNWKEQTQQVIQYLIGYIQNPVHQIQNLPNWIWPVALSVQVAVAVASGILAGIISRSLFNLLTGIFLVPIASVITVFVCSAFLYYTVLLFLNRQLPFQKLVTLTILANLPLLIFQILSSLVPPINLIGFAFTCALLAVGLVENFLLPKRFVLKMVLALYVGFFVIWAMGRFDAGRVESRWKQSAIHPIQYNFEARVQEVSS